MLPVLLGFALALADPGAASPSPETRLDGDRADPAASEVEGASEEPEASNGAEAPEGTEGLDAEVPAAPGAKNIEAPAADEPGSTSPTGASATELIVAAVDRLGEHDLDGARILLQQAEQRTDGREHIAVEIAYHRASAHVLSEDYAAAENIYRRLLAAWPDSHRSDDARFRLAETRAAQGDPDEALGRLKELPRLRKLDDADRSRVRIMREIWRLDTGQRARPRPLRRQINKAPADEIAFYVARGHARLGHLWADRAAQIDIPLRTRRSRRAIAKRTERIQRIEAHLGATIDLREPEWILEAILALVDALDRFGEDLLMVPMPEHLSPAQLELYQSGVYENIEGLWIRALRYADEGRQLAARLEWSGRRVQAIEQRYTDLESKISGP